MYSPCVNNWDLILQKPSEECEQIIKAGYCTLLKSFKASCWINPSCVWGGNVDLTCCGVVTHVCVGVLSLGLGQWGVTVRAVVFTEVIGSLGVGGDQQLLDVSLWRREKTDQQNTKTNVCLVCPSSVMLEVLTWKTSSSSRRAPNTVMPLVSTSALLPRGRGRVIFFLQSSSSVTFFFETEKAMRCHLETRKRNRRRINVWHDYRPD